MMMSSFILIVKKVGVCEALSEIGGGRMIPVGIKTIISKP
jgi:hypothetical protein